MPRGRVKWFSPEKGYGFILLDSDAEAFVHHTSIVGNGFHMLHSDEIVEFDLVDTARGYQAKNVRRLNRNESSEEPSDPQPPDARATG